MANPMSIRDYRDLIVWQRAMDLVETVYRLTRKFPEHERFGLTSQIRRAAVSVPSNIAEGHGRHTTREFLHFLSIASGSLREVQTDLLIAHRLHYIEESETQDAISVTNAVSSMHHGLVRSLKKKRQFRMSPKSPPSRSPEL
jgi:four helix bundle protein